MAVKKPSEMTLTSAEAQRFTAELARGASHISSCLKPETVREAIIEVSEDIARLHGAAIVQRFLFELARRLDERNKLEAANLTRHLAEHGRLPALASATPTSSSRRRATKRAGPAAENDDSATVRSPRRKAVLKLAA